MAQKIIALWVSVFALFQSLPAKAIDLTSAEIRQVGNDPTPSQLVELARWHLRMPDTVRAIELLQDAEDHGHMEASYWIGKIFEKKSNLDEAISSYRRYVSSPDSYDDLSLRAKALFHLGVLEDETCTDPSRNCPAAIQALDGALLLGNLKAGNALGVLLKEQSSMLPEKSEEADRKFSLAAHAGIEKAKFNLGWPSPVSHSYYQTVRSTLSSLFYGTSTGLTQNLVEQNEYPLLALTSSHQAYVVVGAKNKKRYQDYLKFVESLIAQKFCSSAGMNLVSYETRKSDEATERVYSLFEGEKRLKKILITDVQHQPWSFVHHRLKFSGVKASAQNIFLGTFAFTAVILHGATEITPYLFPQLMAKDPEVAAQRLENSRQTMNFALRVIYGVVAPIIPFMPETNPPRYLISPQFEDILVEPWTAVGKTVENGEQIFKGTFDFEVDPRRTVFSKLICQ